MRLRPGEKRLHEVHDDGTGEFVGWVVRPAGWLPWLIDVGHDTRDRLRGVKRPSPKPIEVALRLEPLKPLVPRLELEEVEYLEWTIVSLIESAARSVGERHHAHRALVSAGSLVKDLCARVKADVER